MKNSANDIFKVNYTKNLNKAKIWKQTHKEKKNRYRRLKQKKGEREKNKKKVQKKIFLKIKTRKRMLNRLYLFVMHSGSEFLGRAKKVFNIKLIYTLFQTNRQKKSGKL